MSDILSLGAWIKRRRKALDLTQDDLAQRVGCSLEMIRKIEADARRPSRELAGLLADHLQLVGDERAAFIQAARAELAVDRLASPSQSVVRGAFVPAASPSSNLPLQTSGIVQTLPSGTVTFLFTDIEGSTHLWEQHPQAMPAAVERHTTLLRAAVEGHGGVVFKLVGDAVCAAFASAPQALEAALAAQRALASEEWDATGPLRVRMALHTGSAEPRDGDYLGPPLNRVARLLAAGHGGQILLSLATQELVRDQLPAGATLRDLGAWRLRDIARPEQIFQLITADLPSDFPPLKTPGVRQTNLPHSPTPLLGREQELQQLIALLQRSDARLVTLTGPGGVGKTRLSVQVAAELVDEFADGVYFVDLAPIREAELVTSAIASVLGVRESGGRPLLDRLNDYLRGKRLLLLLDNFEQVLDAAPLVAELLAAAADLKVLVTSREVLHLRGEKEMTVQPLALPNSTQLPPLEQLSQYAAVALFIARALDARLDFQVTNANAPAVAEICVRLDGLPLAIELAAARIKLFSPEMLLARLNNRLPILTGGPRDLPARQRTIRNTIAWSYDLLNGDEQDLFRRLSVFIGGCTLEAAEAVCGGWETGDREWGTRVTPSPTPLFATPTVDGLAALVDKSLLRQVDVPGGDPRFVMLETIGEYALERLEASGDGETTRQQHAKYHLALAEEAERGLRGPEQLAWLERLETEHDNLRAVLTWSQTTPKQATIGLQLAAALWWLWYFHGHFEEGRRWLREVLALPEAQAPTPARGKALASAGLLEWAQGDLQVAQTFLTESEGIGRATAERSVLAFALTGLAWVADFQSDIVRTTAYAEESLALYRALGAPWDQGHILLVLAGVASNLRDHAAADKLGAESLGLFRATGDTWGCSWILLNMGNFKRTEGQYRQAESFLEESLMYSRALGDRWAIAIAFKMLGDLSRTQGDDVRAAARYGESLELLRNLGDRDGVASVFHNQAYLALHQNNITMAAALLTESLALSREVNNPSQIAYDLAGLGGVAAARGQAERAAHLLSAADTWFRTCGDLPAPPEQAEHNSYATTARTQLGEKAFAAAWAEGQAMSLDQAIAEALIDEAA